ncbi:MAG: hypothetical protein RIM33_11875 [Alphaproteobacteria bacterium]
MAYSDLDIKKRFLTRFCITPFEPNTQQLTPVGYDLTIGAAIVLTREIRENGDIIDKFVKTSRFDDGGDEIDLDIPPNTGVVIATHERIFSSGRSLATVHGRSRMTARGLVVNSVTIDPNFDGNILIYMYNATNAVQKIRSHERVLTLIFHGVETETTKEPNTDFHQLVRYYGDLYGTEVANYLMDYNHNWDDSELAGIHNQQKNEVITFRRNSKFKRRITRYWRDWKNVSNEQSKTIIKLISDVTVIPLCLYTLSFAIFPNTFSNLGFLPDPSNGTPELMLYVSTFQVLLFYLFNRLKN